MDFRSLLRDEFVRRRAINRRYTLRSFARALRTDHSSLSQILRSRRALSRRAIFVLGARLGIDASRIAAYCAAECDRVVLRAIARPDFETNTRWIAIRTGMSIDDVNASLQRLLRQRRLAMTNRGTWEVLVG